MNRRLLIGTLSLSFAVACSSGGSSSTGTGGTSGARGGSTGSGGAKIGSGGAGSGGKIGSGGTTGSGGASTGSGGATTGSGGASTGNGGATSGSGGRSTGNGGATTGSGGATTGTGGGSGGRGGGGAGGRGGAGGHGTAGATGTGGQGGAIGGNGGTTTGGAGVTGQTATNVLQFHHNPGHDGVYVDAGLTRAGVANMHLDSTFANTAIMGPVYAQPLYLGGAGTSQPDMVVVATAQNRVYALNAATGAEVWANAQFGTPVTDMLDIPSGNRPVNPYGVLGTPVIDGTTRTLYFDAMTTVGSGARHRVHAVDLSNGMEKSGWPVNVDAAMNAEGGGFNSPGQNQRAALAVLGGRVFIPYSGFIGDAGDYHGWVVGIATATPTDVKGWSTRAPCGGIWGTSGIASDATSIYFVTGNTKASASGGFSSPATYGDGEAVYKLGTTLARPTATTDYFAPSNWAALDQSDTDLGGTGVILFDAPGATPSSLLLALGKDGNAYLLDRANLGGVGGTPVATRKVANGTIIQAGAAYTTPMGTYFVFRGSVTGCPGGTSGGLMAVKVGATSPPTLTPAWCAGPNTAGNAIVSMSDAQGTDAIVWFVGSDNRLYGVNADTGASVLTGAAITLGTVKPHQTPIVANGRVIVASDSRVFALTP